jgi:hypothetical protein
MLCDSAQARSSSRGSRSAEYSLGGDLLDHLAGGPADHLHHDPAAGLVLVHADAKARIGDQSLEPACLEPIGLRRTKGVGEGFSARLRPEVRMRADGNRCVGRHRSAR